MSLLSAMSLLSVVTTRRPVQLRYFGDRSMLAIMPVLESSGLRVYLPFSENTRCDLVLDDGDGLHRVQCKTGRMHAGAVRFKTCSSYAHHPHPKIAKRDYGGEVDYFGVYCRETGAVYLVPIADLSVTRAAALRVEPARNAQRRRIRPAEPYLMGRVDLTTLVPEQVNDGRSPRRSGRTPSLPERS
jgi:hypothetical protein